MQIPISRKQNEFLEALKTRFFKFLVFGGGTGSGKSTVLALAILGCANQFKQTRYGVFRKNLTVLKRTSLQTFIRVADKLGIDYTLNRADLTMTLTNSKSQILFLELDNTKDPEFNKIKGLELTAAGIDEINEVVEKAFSTLITRIGRWNFFGEPSFILGTCNPDIGWVKNKWYDPYVAGSLQKPFYFLQALPKDNPFLTQEYLDGLEYLPPAEYKRYVEGDWDVTSDEFQIITYEILFKSLVDSVSDEIVGPQKLGIDVARTGADDTVFTRIDDEKIFPQVVYHGNDTMETGSRAIMLIDEQAILHQNTNIDTIGVGAGVFDYIRMKGYNVQSFNSAESPSKVRDDSFEFFNRRAEAYWDLRTRFNNSSLLIPKDQIKLIQELLASRYEIRGKKIIVESKEKIKKRLGRSPDKADSLVMANYTPNTNTFVVLTG